MIQNILHSLTLPKYERLLSRLFPEATGLELVDLRGDVIWRFAADTGGEQAPGSDTCPDVSWSESEAGFSRRQLPGGQQQFRSLLSSRELGDVGWLVACYDVQTSIPISAAPDPLQRAFDDAAAFIQEEIDLQSECNQLAIELTERYEELNLVYSTNDKVDYFDDVQDALVQLVRNCADYLDVDFAALLCRDRNISMHSANNQQEQANIDSILFHLETSVYDHVEAHVHNVILNKTDEAERKRLFGDRSENLLAFPIMDDHAAAIGLLAVVARHDNHTFSNGDRNLMEVMAKKASKIIHTHHDSLTGLINRSGFESSLVATYSGSRLQKLHHCVLHIDIDKLHVVNDLMGHEVGDNLIRRVAKSMHTCVRDSDIVARLGGDEFGILLQNCSTQDAHKIAEKIRNFVHDLAVVSASRQLNVSASIGIASVNTESEGIVGVLASAEIACKSAKETGGDRIQVFEKDNTLLVRRTEEIEWIGKIQQALRNDQFLLYCQPVTPLMDPSAAPHFEILVRMLDNDGEILAPGLFMPAAERYQLMPMLDRWIIRQSFRSLTACWNEIVDARPVFCINLSGQSLTNPGFDLFVTDELAASGIPPQNFCFEITETAAISNIDDAIAFMGRLRDLGCSFSLDDFGAGLSSFGYLKVLPVDYLKIDGSFVREVTSDVVSHSMVNAICQIGRTMGLSMVAEFVNGDETIQVLRKIGVDYVQGYGIGRPVPLSDVTDRLKKNAGAVSA